MYLPHILHGKFIEHKWAWEIFFCYSIYIYFPCNHFAYIFEWASNKTTTSHSIRYTYLSKILNKNIAWEKATYSFQFLLNHLFFNRVNEMHLIWLQHQQIWY